jgi:hypothetical protein
MLWMSPLVETSARHWCFSGTGEFSSGGDRRSRHSRPRRIDPLRVLQRHPRRLPAARLRNGRQVAVLGEISNSAGVIGFHVTTIRLDSYNGLALA